VQPNITWFNDWHAALYMPAFGAIVVDDAELTKASGTEHHGGVCFLIKKRNGTTVSAEESIPRICTSPVARLPLPLPVSTPGISRNASVTFWFERAPNAGITPQL
jgi:hypothetical protein